MLPKLPFSLPQCGLVFCIALLALMAFLFDNLLAEVFIYQRELISQGELWRLMTGHFFHTNGYHLLLNCAALFMLWSLHGHYYNVTNYSILFLCSAIICSLGLYFFKPSIIQYVGLSGVLHGIFVWGALMDIRAKEKTGYLLFVGVWLKIGHEQLYGASEDVISLIDASVAIDAHLWGAIGGLLFSMIYFAFPLIAKKLR